MGLTWCDEPTRPVIDLTRRRDRIIDIRPAADRARTAHPDAAEVAAIRWTMFGVRCSIELTRAERSRASGDPEVVRSGS